MGYRCADLTPGPTGLGGPGMARLATFDSEQSLPDIPRSHINYGIFYVYHIRKRIRKCCFETARPLKGFRQESELVSLLFLTRSLSCLCGEKI